MLGADRDPQPLNAWLTGLACEIELPAAWQDFFDKTGLVNSFAGDTRRFPRFQVRARAALECSQSLPAMPRQTAWKGIFTKDVGRAGLGFLHSEQLYPREQMRILLADGVPRVVEVVHCRRIQSHCYEIGARFVIAGRAGDDESSDETGLQGG